MLTDREKTILNLIVGDYIAQATPVASKSIARKHALGVSPATIRNDVVELEHGGFITRPHPSAGSVPLDKGYRVYVESTASANAMRISPALSASIRKRLSEVERDVDEWTSVAAAVLAELVGNLAIATFPKARESRVLHVELVALQDLLVLLIVVFEQARLKRQLIRLKDPLEPADLQVSANKVCEMVTGRTWKQIEAIDAELSPLEGELVSTTALMLKDEDRAEYHDHYLDGLRKLLAQPESAENDRVRSVVESVEDGSLAQAVLEESPDTGGVRVVIGQENRGDMLWPLSVVITSYGVFEEVVGVVGAVGPMRMEYDRTIAGVHLMAGMMGEMAEGVTRP